LAQASARYAEENHSAQAERNLLAALDDVRRDRKPVPVDLVCFEAFTDDGVRGRRFYCPQSADSTVYAVAEVSALLSDGPDLTPELMDDLPATLDKCNFDFDKEAFGAFLLANEGYRLKVLFY
jgi:hypothetical protein